MAVTMEVRERLFDDAIQASELLSFSEPEAPSLKEVEVQQGVSPLTVDHMPMRDMEGLKHIFIMFDHHHAWKSTVKASFIVDEVRANGAERLPLDIRPPVPLSDDTRMQLIFQQTDYLDTGDVEVWTYDVLKVFTFRGGLQPALAIRLAIGQRSSVLHRAHNTWGVKKAVTSMMDLIPSTQLRCWFLSSKVPAGKDRSKAQGLWDPSPEEVALGMKFLETKFPSMAGELVQLEWMINNRRNGSPIHGWPEIYVNKAAQALNKVQDGATRETFYPLIAHNDLKNVFVEQILPKCLASAKHFAWLLAGWPGIGKTQFAKMLAMLQGRYLQDEDGNEQYPPCWRRGKKLERFNKLPQQPTEMLMLDDPDLQGLGFEDAKAFGELTEIGSGDGRYSDCKYGHIAPRALLTNTVVFDEEPDFVMNGTIDPKAFWAMTSNIFGHMKEADKLAIFKRYVSIIGGRKGVYVRLPSEDPEAVVFFYDQDDVAHDWLKSERKDYLSKYKNGVNAKYPGYEEAVSMEKAWAKIHMNSMPVAHVASPDRLNVIPGTPSEIGDTQRLHVRPDAQGRCIFPIPLAGRGSALRRRFRLPGEASSSSDTRVDVNQERHGVADEVPHPCDGLGEPGCKRDRPTRAASADDHSLGLSSPDMTSQKKIPRTLEQDALSSVKTEPVCVPVSDRFKGIDLGVLEALDSDEEIAAAIEASLKPAYPNLDGELDASAFQSIDDSNTGCRPVGGIQVKREPGVMRSSSSSNAVEVYHLDVLDSDEEIEIAKAESMKLVAGHVAQEAGDEMDIDSAS
jgi:hypothetical protein